MSNLRRRENAWAIETDCVGRDVGGCAVFWTDGGDGELSGADQSDPVKGPVDLEFRIYDAEVAGNVVDMDGDGVVEDPGDGLCAGR